MAERIKLNKVSLREQKQKRAMYERFLPALEARKQQFLTELAIVRKEIREQEAVLNERIQEISSWSPLYRDVERILPFFVSVREVKLVWRNVAGLRVPEFQAVIFDEPLYSLFATPYSFDEVIRKTREAISLREKMRVLKEQEHMVSEGFRKTSQRINLYEQKLIPECREAIRKISVYLQDQQAAAVGVAKVAKALSEEASYYAAGH
jgi:V/A-type H+/Na+-transporting ATPase subunit D